MTAPEGSPRVMHEGETLRIIELVDERGWVENHDFLRCTIWGPAVVMFSGGTMQFNRIQGFPDECFYEAGEDRERYAGVVILRNCAFESCTFLNVGFTGPPDHLKDFRESFEPA